MTLKSLRIALLALALFALPALATQSVILSANNTAATSSTVTVNTNAVFTINGSFGGCVADLPLSHLSNGVDVVVGVFNPSNRRIAITGAPGQYRVKRPDLTACSTASIEVDSDVAAAGTGTIPAPGQAVMANSVPVVIASDQSAIPTNLTQIAGASVPVGHGVAATAQRVELPTDGTGVVGLNAGTNLIGKVGIDQTTPGTTNLVQSSNLPSTVSTGSGAAGASSPRVTVATDSATVAGSASLPAGTNNIGVEGYAQAATTSGEVGPLMQGAVTTGVPTYVTANTDPLSLTTLGTLRIDLGSINGTSMAAGTGVTGAGVPRVAPVGVGSTGSAVPASAGYIAGQAATTYPTNVSGGNLSGFVVDHSSQLVVTPYAIPELRGCQYTQLSSSGETTVLTAGASGVFNDITSILITTAGSAAATITLKDGTGGTTKAVINYPNAALAPGAPFSMSFTLPMTQGAAAANWTMTNSVTTATNVTICYVMRK